MSKPKKKGFRDSMSNPLPEGDDSIAANEYRDTIGSPPALSMSRPY